MSPSSQTAGEGWDRGPSPRDVGQAPQTGDKQQHPIPHPSARAAVLDPPQSPQALVLTLPVDDGVGIGLCGHEGQAGQPAALVLQHQCHGGVLPRTGRGAERCFPNRQRSG